MSPAIKALSLETIVSQRECTHTHTLARKKHAAARIKVSPRTGKLQLSCASARQAGGPQEDRENRRGARAIGNL